MTVASPVGCSDRFSFSFLISFNSTLSACRCLILIMPYTYALNRKGLKAGSVYAFDKGYALNNGVRLTTMQSLRYIVTHNQKVVMPRGGLRVVLYDFIHTCMSFYDTSQLLRFYKRIGMDLKKHTYKAYKAACKCNCTNALMLLALYITHYYTCANGWVMPTKMKSPQKFLSQRYYMYIILSSHNYMYMYKGGSC